MSREIKFRLWDKSISKYVVNPQMSVATFNDSIVLYINSPKIFIHEQYTGLNDKNQKDIYEGDVLKVGYMTYFYQTRYFEAEVIFRNGAFYTKHVPKTEFELPEDNVRYKLLGDLTDVEIVGNIHENPELLGE